MRNVSVEPSAKAKNKIQGLLRSFVILRDGGCFLGDYRGVAGSCGGYKQNGDLVLQADHLNSRQYNVSYADTRNVVCICRYHHGVWKKRNPGTYMMLAKQYVVDNFGEAQWAYVERVMVDRKIYPMGAFEWHKAIKAIEQEISTLEELRKRG